MIPPSGTPRDELLGARVEFYDLTLIMEFMHSPRDILNVGRVSKRLREAVRDEHMGSSFKVVRHNYPTGPIPDPPKCLGFTEYTYACFIFNPGKCDNCKVETNQMYTSFAIPLRLCSKPECRKDATRNRGCLVSESRPDPNNVPIYMKILLRIESDKCVYKHPISPQDYPNSALWFHRKRYGALKDEYVTSWNTESLSTGFEEKYAKDVQEHEEKMQFFVALFNWSRGHLARVSQWRLHNKAAAARHAGEHGRTSHELINTNTYGALTRIRSARFEGVTDDDWALVKDQVLNKELATTTLKRERRDALVESQDLYMQTKVFWAKMRKSGDLGYLPTLYQFKRLKTLQSVLQPKPVSLATNPSDAKTKPKKAESLETQLANSNAALRRDLDKFRQDTRRALTDVLGVSWSGTASKTIVNPVERVTALFRCRVCDAKTLNGPLKDPLDFKRVCCHDCPAAEPAWRGKSLFLKDNYVKDDKAIAAVSKVLQKLGLDAERANTAEAFANVGARVKCATCAAPHPIIMDAQAVGGHARRHDSMVLEVLDKGLAHAALNSFVGEVEVGLVARVPVTLLNPAPARPEWPPTPALPTKPGTTRAKAKWREVVAFGCRHCERKSGDHVDFDDMAKLKASFINHSRRAEDVEMGEVANAVTAMVEEGEISESAKNSYKRKAKKNKGLREKGVKAVDDEGNAMFRRVWKHYNFDGVKSHLKKAHRIDLARDEDLYFDWAECTRLGFQKPEDMQAEDEGVARMTG